MYIEVALAFVVVLVFLLIMDRKPSDMPPGPFEIPFFGNFPILSARQADDLRKKYGNVVTCRTGSVRTVLIFDHKIATEAMAMEEISGRPTTFKNINFDDYITGGVVGSEGIRWQCNRQFVLRNLRKMCVGNSYMEEAINAEAKALVEDLRKYDGQPVQSPDCFRIAPLNVIWQFVAGRRYDLRSLEAEAVYKATSVFRKQVTQLEFLSRFIPVLMYLPKQIRNLLFNEAVIDHFPYTISELVQISLKEHEENFDPENPHDLIDEYLKEMKDNDEFPASLLSVQVLKDITTDLFGAGTDTVCIMLRWITHILARECYTVRKLTEELERVIPSGKFVSLDDRPNLPYMEAFITECLRYASMMEFNAARTATTDINLDGYYIPKGTRVVACNYWIHNDREVWKKPYQFAPIRFLDRDGNYKAPRDGMFAFGSGRRRCLGENLARAELFLFTAAIVQHFTIELPKENYGSIKVEFFQGMRVPKDTTLKYVPRSLVPPQTYKPVKMSVREINLFTGSEINYHF